MAKSLETVVLFPYSSGMGHMIPMVELAKLFISHNFSVTILILEPPHSAPINSSFISRVSDAYPSISFHRLPKLAPPANLSPIRPLATMQHLRQSSPLLSTFLTSLSKNTTIRALVLDMFCTFALDVARDLDLPAYIFFASSASALSAFVTISSIQSQIDCDFKDLGDASVNFPGIPPIPASHLPFNIQERGSGMHSARMYDYERLSMADGILVNSFESLEGKAVEALRDGSCFPGRPMPPVYCIGPLIAEADDQTERHECLRWLDMQPKGSVVFMCFGSMGSFSAEQLKEIAVGLERSEQRFLWVIGNPPSDDLDSLLPEGFEERTRERGMVVKSWAPQAAVLEHESVGGFVSHCGWNSTLEVVSAGVPIVAWPLYAEQRMNKLFLVGEAKLAVEMKGYDKEMVSAEEVETKIRWLMESEGGRELKNRAVEMKDSAVAAREKGGSSAAAWTDFVSALRKEY